MDLSLTKVPGLRVSKSQITPVFSSRTGQGLPQVLGHRPDNLLFAPAFAPSGERFSKRSIP